MVRGLADPVERVDPAILVGRADPADMTRAAPADTNQATPEAQARADLLTPAGGSAAVPEPADSAESGDDDRAEMRRPWLWIKMLGAGVLYVVVNMFGTDGDGDTSAAHWVIPAWGVLLAALGVVSGTTGHGWNCLWFGIALLAVTAIYQGFKFLRRLIVRTPQEGPESSRGKHIAG